MSRRLHVWITGAGSGLGAAMTRSLADVAVLSLSGRRAGPLEALVEEIGSETTYAATCDVSRDAEVEKAHATIVERFGHVDVLINNAGIAMFSGALDTTMESYAEQLNVNLLGAIRCVRQVLPGMKARSGGMIITMNSVASTTVFADCTAYAASKAGLLAYTRGLRAEVRQHGVKVVDLIVGATATPIWSSDMIDQHGQRMINANDVAGVVRDVILRYDNSAMMIEELTIRPQLGDL